MKFLYLSFLIAFYSCATKVAIIYPKYSEVNLKSFYNEEIIVEVKHVEGVYCQDKSGKNDFLSSCLNSNGKMLYSEIEMIENKVHDIVTNFCEGSSFELVGLRNDREIAGKAPTECNSFSSGTAFNNVFINSTSVYSSVKSKCVGGEDLFNSKKDIIFKCQR